MKAARVISIKRKREYSPRNPRVRRVSANEWQVQRVDAFKHNCRFAAAAKSFRTAMGVTQAEVSKALKLDSGAAARRESGCYFGWDQKTLVDYCNIIRRIAAQNGGN